jgi:acyl carrier protein
LTNEQIYAQLTEIFRNLFDDDSIVLTPETTAADITEWDSFNHINLIVATEVRFGIKFKTAEIESLHNVGHLVDIIAAKLVGADA